MPYTPRQLRTIADRCEQLTKARVTNAAMGVPVTPDVMNVRFPSGHHGTVRWAEAELTSDASRRRNGGKAPWRYVVELEPAARRDSIHIDVNTAKTADEVCVEALRHIRRNGTQGVA